MEQSTPKRSRRFAPLNPEKASKSNAPKLKGIVFDVDGTLCEPQNYMFAQMRNALSIPKSTDILDHIYSLPTPSAQEDGMNKIRAIEQQAMASQKPQPGLEELMLYLRDRGVRRGICTRNFDLPVSHLLSKFLPGHEFAPIITRDFRPPKPNPAGILHIAKEWGLDDGGEGLIMVGDSIDDMTAGHRAGAATVLLANEVNAHLVEHEHTHFSITRLDELIQVLEEGFKVGEEGEGGDGKGDGEFTPSRKETEDL